MITIDKETKSWADLKKVGAYAYAEHPTTEVICLAYGIDAAPIQTWWPGKYAVDDPWIANYNMPTDLYMAMMKGHCVEAHNVAFEWSIWDRIMTPKFGWLQPLEHKWRDTMAVACYYALPASLDRLLRALDMEGKDPEGARLITKYSKLHLKTAKKIIPPEDFEKFVAYCVDDVVKEQAVSDELGNLPAREMAAWMLDIRINVRGLHLDAAGISAASAIMEQRQGELTEEFRALTGFGPAQHAKVKAWFEDQGLVLENLQKDTLVDVLEEGNLGQGPARRALELRLKANKASTKKLDAMSRQRGSDGRARWQTRYHGAQTGRSTASGIGVLNMNRGFDNVPPERLVSDIMLGNGAWLDAQYGDAMDAIGKATRHWITAEPGNKIISGDFASIEAIILACVAGEEWKVQAFRDGIKSYDMMGDKIHGLPPGTVTKKTHPKEYSDGKIGELAFGYQGSLGAWLNFDKSGRHTDERILEINKAWRGEHPSIVAFWQRLQWDAIDTVQTGKPHGFYEIVDEWLTCILPNDKRIWYRDPWVTQCWPNWHRPLENDDCGAGICSCKKRATLSYMANKNGQWRRTYTYGGKQTENYVQAVSREILIPALLKVEEVGYDLIFAVYDEAVAENDIRFGNPEHFAAAMVESVQGTFAETWPIRASAWQGPRYRK